MNDLKMKNHLKRAEKTEMKTKKSKNMNSLKKRSLKDFAIAFCLLASFVLWTAAVSCFDVQPVGPRGSSVGFAAVNVFIHNLTGVHMPLYTVTDWLGLVPLFLAAGFAVLGFVQLLKRRSLFKVDYSILVLGGFYIIVIALYLFFEMFVINYRPVLIDGYLEASYPSSTTMLVMCVIPTAIMQLQTRIRNTGIRKTVSCIMMLFTAFMIIGRLLSGVHWFTDIIGGILLSAGLVMLYHAVISLPVQSD